MKPIRFVGTARGDLPAFPKSARTRAGYDLFMVQVGRNPDNWKAMTSVGAGVCEIRVRDPAGAYRVLYVARFAEARCTCCTHFTRRRRRRRVRT